MPTPPLKRLRSSDEANEGIYINVIEADNDLFIGEGGVILAGRPEEEGGLRVIRMREKDGGSGRGRRRWLRGGGP